MDDDPSSSSSELPEKAPVSGQSARRNGSNWLAYLWEELKRRHVVRVVIAYAVVGWAIMQVGDTVLPNLGAPQWMLTGLIVLVILGFPISFVLAWVYEITPKGIQVTGTRGRGVNRTLMFSAAVVPTVLFSTLAMMFFFKAKTATDELVFVTESQFNELTENSIAVLPLENLSVDEEDAFLATGLHHELTTVVSRIRSLKTIARNSTVRYRGTTKSSKTIAEELGVVNLVTGAVQRVGQNIRINVQLIDPESERSVWGESYFREYTPDDLFSIQSEICRSIALELSIMLTPEEDRSIAQVPTDSLEAFEAYLRGNEILANGNQVSMPEAVEWFERAIELDRKFTLAYVGLALSYDNYGTPLIERPLRREDQKKKVAERRQKLRAAADTAFALDYDLPGVQVLQGIVKRIEGDYDGVEASFKRAVDLNPNYADAYYRLCLLLSYRLRTMTYPEMVTRYAPDGPDPGAGALEDRINREVVSWVSKAVDLEPTNANYRRLLANVLSSMGRKEEQIAQRKLAIKYNPNQASLHLDLGRRLSWSLGRNDEAMIHLRKSLALDPLSLGININIATAFEFMGDFAEAERWTRRAMALDTPVAHLYEARLLEFLGEDELALMEYRENLANRGLRGASRARTKVLFDDLRTGRLQEARARYFAAYPQYFEPDLRSFTESLPFSVVTSDFGQYALELAAVLMATGETEQANRLMDEAWRYYEFYLKGHYKTFIESMILVMRGDKQRALQVLRNGFDEGLRGKDRMLDARFDPIRNEPEFIEMMEVIDADQAMQLANVRRMERNGELAAIPELPPIK